MKRKILRSQTFNSSIFLELSDREAEYLQGGATKALDNLSYPGVISLVLLFANPFAG